MRPRRSVFFITAGAAFFLGVLATAVVTSTAVSAQPAPKTFNKDVAPIIFQHCASCHRPGDAAPFSLLNYADVKRRAKLIADATASHYMPPWQPDSHDGEFEGDRRLSDRDIQTIREWTEGGQLEGEASALPPAPNFGRTWRLGIPDAVVTLGESFVVPADGPDVFRNFVIPVPLTDRKFVKAMEFRPGNARVVHHARILLDDTGEVRRLDAADSEVGFGGMDVQGAHFPDGHFLGWAPGKMPDVEAYPWPLEPGTDLVLQLHLKPIGRQEEVQPSIALYFTDQPPAATPIMVRLGDKAIDIPAGAARHEIVDSFELPVDVTLFSVYPHAHYLAREMEITAKKSDGSVERLLRIPNWNFNWQDEYSYRRPIDLKKGTIIQMRYSYDNSAANPHNPSSPPRRVVFGSETTDEMGELLLQVLPKKPSESAKLRADVGRKNILMDIAGEEKRLRDRPDDVENRNALGVGYAQVGRGAEATKQFLEVVRTSPGHAQANYNLGIVAISERRFDEAFQRFSTALATRPDYAEAHNNLGVLLESTGRADEALAQYRTALEPSPDHADALYNLGRAYLAQGRSRDAAQQLKHAIASRPDGLQILIDYAWLLALNPDVRNTSEAVKQAERANQLSGNQNAAVLDVLAAAYAADGRVDLAQRTGQRALQRAIALKDQRLAQQIRQRLETYQQGSGEAGGWTVIE